MVHKSLGSSVCLLSGRKLEVGVHPIDFPFDHQALPILLGDELTRLAKGPALSGERLGEELDFASPRLGPNEDYFEGGQHEFAVKVLEFLGSRREVLGIAEEWVVG